MQLVSSQFLLWLLGPSLGSVLRLLNIQCEQTLTNTQISSTCIINRPLQFRTVSFPIQADFLNVLWISIFIRKSSPSLTVLHTPSSLRSIGRLVCWSLILHPKLSLFISKNGIFNIEQLRYLSVKLLRKNQTTKVKRLYLFRKKGSWFNFTKMNGCWTWCLVDKKKFREIVVNYGATMANCYSWQL